MPTNEPMPLMPPVSTELRMAHFDQDIYDGTPGTVLFRWMDAMVGTSGVGALINHIMLTRMTTALDTIYYNDLDYIFGKVQFLARSPEESYVYNPQADQLTTAQWDEVRTKDAWFRQRIKDFWVACALGGTPEGLRMGILAALGCDANIYEVWRYKDNFGLIGILGRAPVTARNEVVIQPHRTNLAPAEVRLARDMLDKFAPLETIVTINAAGLSVAVPVTVSAAASDSVYYEVIKTVTPSPVLSQIPAPELLPINLNDSQQWLLGGVPTEAPTAAFNSTSEYSVPYLIGGGTRSQIDSVSYGTLNADGSVSAERDFQTFTVTGSFTDWIGYEKADSPDNYPGGKFGITPATAPALNPDGTVYHFTFTSQSAYVTVKTLQVQALGGIADSDHYKLPIAAVNTTSQDYYASYSVASSPPPKESTVSASLTSARGLTTGSNTSLDLRTFARTQ